MDQGLKYMVGLYVGIFLVVGIFAVSTGNSEKEPSLVAAGLGEKSKPADYAQADHQPFNQVKFESGESLFAQTKSDDQLAHRPLNIVKFRSDSHEAFNQVRFSTSNASESGFEASAKTKSGERSEHRPLNIVRFDPEPHQAFNVVGFEKKD